MREKMKLLLQCLIIALTVSVTAVYAQETELIEYDIVYTVSTVDGAVAMNITFTVYNGEDETKQPLLIAAVYDGGKLTGLKTAEPEITSGTAVNEGITVTIPNDKTNDCYVKLMVWESKGNIRPLGDSKTVNDIDSYLREKYLYVTASENSEFKVYMNASDVKGGNGDATHTVEYDVSKLAPVDLCGFTYEKELSADKVENTDITIERADTENGIITYRFESEKGRNTGINNVIKFKALTEITGAEIKYIIQ